jgi:hypothetical protein
VGELLEQRAEALAVQRELAPVLVVQPVLAELAQIALAKVALQQVRPKIALQQVLVQRMQHYPVLAEQLALQAQRIVAERCCRPSSPERFLR